MSASAVVLGSFAVLILIVAASLTFLVWKRRRVSPNTILEADFSRDFEEHQPEDRLGRILRRRAPGLLDAVEALRMASEDPRVTLLVAKVGGSGMQMAKVQEIRDAVARFRLRGKKALAYAESFGELGSSTTAYYLATAFDRIFLQPSGSIGLTGLGMRTPFLRDLLERLGIEPQLGFRKEYKSAAYTFIQSEYTEPHREADEAVLRSLFSQVREGITHARGIGPEKLMSIFDSGPFTARRALEEKLVDGLAYRDEVREGARKESGRGAKFLALREYLRKKGGLSRGKKRIALIYGVGRIAPGKSRSTPLGRFVMGSDTVCAAFRAARKDPGVGAIVFRIDSPGGSYAASDAIWRETICARRDGKPVIASMSDVAGSGGYFVSMACDRVIAHPGTITGSIGVVSGKLVASGLWNKVGVRWGTLFTNRNADFWSDTTRYSAEQWKHLDGLLDEIYEDFLRKAAEGRKMDIESVDRVARGRIWTGRDALEKGLVDELGGFHEAILAARAAAKIPDGERVGLKIFPPRRPLWRRLGRGVRDEAEEMGFLQGLKEELDSELLGRGDTLRARSPFIET